MDTSILVYRPKGITLQARVGHYRLVLGLRWVRKAFWIPICCYRVALGDNERTKNGRVRVLVEYGLLNDALHCK